MFDLAHKQCNGNIKGWLHRLASESKGKLLVNNILMFGSAWCLLMAQIQLFFNKKNKDWTSRTLPNPPPPTSNNISFLPCLPLPPTLKVDDICASPLNKLENIHKRIPQTCLYLCNQRYNTNYFTEIYIYICSKPTKETGHRSVLSLLLNLSKFSLFFWCVYCWF